MEAVKDVSLDIPDGEFLVLVGPSGCGKSTTLRMIAGLEEVTDGAIHIDGVLVNDVAPKDRDVAMVFQNYALYPHMTVYENMAFGLKLRKVPKSEIAIRITKTAGFLGLDGLLDRLPKSLSGGQRQRVAVGRAIVRQPKAFLFDEPLSNLDAQMRVQTRMELARLHDQLGATMIYVTHDQVEAMTLGDRIAVLHEGRVQQVAAPLVLYKEPANRFVAGFIGSPPMNFFDGHLKAEGVGMRFVAQDGLLDWQIPEGHVPDLGASDGLITLGLRPEALSARPDAASQGGAACAAGMEGEIDLVEPLGVESWIHLRTGSHRYIAKVPGMASVAVLDRIRVQADLTQSHWFSPVNGERLSHKTSQSKDS